MVPYILHASLLVSACYLFYKFLLERETFFHINRWVLAACIVMAFSLPRLTIPEQWSLWNGGSFGQAVLQSGSPQSGGPQINASTHQQINTFQAGSPTVGAAADEPQADINPAVSTPRIIDSSNPRFLDSSNPPILDSSNTKPLTKFSVAQILTYIYLTGVVIFGLNFLLQLGILLYLRFSRPGIRDGRFRIVELTEDKAPYSFWNNIFINPARYEWETFNQILRHEKIHIAQRHTLDILLAELLVIVQWFNPFAWYYRKAVENNLEFLTDKTMLASGADKQSYQLNLLKVCVPQLPLNLTTNYNQSILKRRIVMMNSKKSSVSSAWKYLFLLPLLGLSIFTLNAVKSTAQNLHTPGGLLAFLDDQPETTAIPGMEGFTNNGAYLEPSGKWYGRLTGNEFCVEFVNRETGKWGRNQWSRSECFDKSAFTGLSAGATEFRMDREAGTMVFQGKFEGNDGEGQYTFTEKPEFRAYLQQEGFSDVPDELMVHFFLADISKAWFAYLKQNGYTKITEEELEAAAVHSITLDYLKKSLPEFQAYGFKNMNLSDLVQFTIHDVTPEYIKSMKDLGYKDFSVEEIVQASIHDVNPAYIKALKEAGYSDLPMETLVQFSIHDVDAKYIKALDEAGFRKLSPEEIVQFSIHDVDADFIKSLKASGMGDMSAEEIVQYAIHDVDADYIKSLEQAGIKGLDRESVVQLSIHDVDAEYIQSLAQAGIKDLNVEQIVQYAIHDVDAEYIRDMEQAGFKDLDQEKIIQLAIHDVDADFVKSLEQAGFSDLDMDEIVQMAIHDVDVDYIKSLRDLGLDKLSLEEIVQASIHDVEPSEIKELQALGYKGMGIEEIVQLQIHDVDADFIKGLNALGFKNIPVEQLVQAQIHDVDEDFIKEMREKGHNSNDLEDYIKLKYEREGNWSRSRKRQE